MIDAKKVEELFSEKGVKYRVPIYQRHYIWDERNWGHIWDDIKSKYEEVKEANSRRREAEERGEYITLEEVPPHFTGVIVISAKGADYEIIDGQQRLTTFQIILCVIRDLASEAGNQNFSDSVRDTLIQNPASSKSPTGDQFKLLPTEGANQVAFIQLASGRVKRSSGRIREAYDYFKQTIEDYVSEGSDSISDLLYVFLQYFSIVPLYVTNSQGAKVFESINGRGLALAQFDHLRNNVFLRAGDSRSRLYTSYWDHFNTEDSWLLNKFVDSFLEDFLKAKLGSRFNKDNFSLFDLYQQEYRKDLQKKLAISHEENLELVEHEFKELQQYSDVYTEITSCGWEDPLWLYNFLSTNFGNTNWHPLILALKSERADLGISDSDLTLTLKILESYIVRRMLCFGRNHSTPRYYKEFVLDLITWIRSPGGF